VIAARTLLIVGILGAAFAFVLTIGETGRSRADRANSSRLSEQERLYVRFRLPVAEFRAISALLLVVVAIGNFDEIAEFGVSDWRDWSEIVAIGLIGILLGILAWKTLQLRRALTRLREQEAKDR